MQEVISTITIDRLDATIRHCKELIGNQTLCIDMARKLGCTHIVKNVRKINEYIGIINYCESVREAIHQPAKKKKTEE